MPRQTGLKTLDVVVGVVADDRDQILIQQRTDGPFAGLWEFPGGKREAHETPEAALARELAEENGIDVAACRPLIRIKHTYPDRVVSLNTFDVTAYRGKARGAEGQNVRFVPRRALFDEPMLPADRPLSVAINLPSRYLITPDPAAVGGEPEWLAALDASLAMGVRLVCLRAPALDDDAYGRLARLAQARCASYGATLLVHGHPQRGALARELAAGGLHVPQRYARDLTARPVDADLWFAVSAHGADELAAAAALGADFCVLGTVQATPTHPHGPILGWPAFTRLADAAALPVYAIGGMHADDVAQARRCGAQGIAAIRGLWGPPRGPTEG